MFTTGNRRLPLTAAIIVLAVYNVVIFVLPFDLGAGFWTGYAFSILASQHRETAVRRAHRSREYARRCADPTRL